MVLLKHDLLICPSIEAGISNKKTGSGIPIPFPFVDLGKAWSVLSDPTFFKGPEVSEKEGMAIVNEYKRQYNDYKRKGGTRSYGSWIKWKGYGRGLIGGAIDIHKAIGNFQNLKKDGLFLVTTIPVHIIRLKNRSVMIQKPVKYLRNINSRLE